ncbi:MAG: TonB-dependent siderophore receptor [Cyanobacteria bacterium P01_G01_bin.67]
MVNRLYLFVLTGLFSLVTIPVFSADVQGRGSAKENLKQNNISYSAADLFLKDTSHIAQSNLTRVTGVEVNQTESGLELILKTEAGSERLVPLILPEGNDLVIDILDATLAFSIRNGVTETNPTPGINKITVSKANENSIRVRITGANQTPSAEVVPGRDDLVLSVTPQDTTAQEEPDEQIDIIATGQADDEDSYLVPAARSLLKTDVELRDTPGAVQVIPQEVFKDQGAATAREVLRNTTGVTIGKSTGDRDEAFIIRGFSAENGVFRNGFRDDLFSTRAARELGNIERVEVLRGPAAILFGRSDPAGIINFVTEKPTRETFYEIAFTAGSFDFYRTTIDLSGPLTKNGELAYRLNATYENGGNFRDDVDEERFFVAPTLSWQISDDTELVLEFSFLDDEQPIDNGIVALSNGEVADIPFSTFLGNPDIEGSIDENRTELTLDHRFNDNLSLRTLLRYSTATESHGGTTSGITGESEDDQNFPVTETGDLPQFFETFAAQNDLTGKFNTGPLEHTVLLGVEYFTAVNTFTIESRTGTIDIFNASAFESPDEGFEFIANGEFTTESFGIFLQDQIAILDNLQLVIGGRFDTVNNVSSG